MALLRHLFMLVLLLSNSALNIVYAETTVEPSSLLQLVDYVGVDYPGAVQGGEVLDENEYAEMVEFSGRVQEGLAALTLEQSVREQLLVLSERLVEQIGQRVAAEQVASTCQQIRNLMMSHVELDLLPRQLPDLAVAEQLYQAQCSACHGASGHGDGPLATALTPPPTDFSDAQRARERSLFALYNTITLGVDGTGMAPFNQLSDNERWALAFYVGGQYGAAASTAQWRAAPLTLEQAVLQTPAELAASSTEGESLALYARQQPAALFASASKALDIARTGIANSALLYQQGEVAAAKQAAIEAYLEGFELVEVALKNISPEQMSDIEVAMMGYRSLLNGSASAEQVNLVAAQLIEQLNEADHALSGGSLSATVAFTSALIILLREGLEAILVLAAMAAFLLKSGRRDAMRWLHAGWILALLAGGATWAVSNWLFTISGATREITEGITALIAALILFYVGFWMHSRASAKKWNQYIGVQMQTALSRGTLWSFALVSFLAVYREIFETILFYQTLWLQVAEDARHAVIGGGLAATLLLLLIVFIISRFGMRIPLQRFFMISAYLMIALAFIFVGKGIAALQEAGSVTHSLVAFPRIDLLGIYPSLEGLGAQALVLVLTALLVWRQRRLG